jgi:hypothetical protein
MGFNLHFAEPEHRRPHKRDAHSSRKHRLLPALALCLAASLMGDLLLA